MTRDLVTLSERRSVLVGVPSTGRDRDVLGLLPVILAAIALAVSSLLEVWWAAVRKGAE